MDAITSAKAAEASYIQYTGRMQELVHLFKLAAYRVVYSWIQKPCEVMMIRYGGNSLEYVVWKKVIWNIFLAVLVRWMQKVARVDTLYETKSFNYRLSDLQWITGLEAADIIREFSEKLLAL